MTVIVAARLAEGGVCIAADSQVTTGWIKEYDHCKLWTTGQYVLGGAGSVRDLQVMRYHVTPARWYSTEDSGEPEAHIVRNIIPAMRSAAADHGIRAVQHNVDYMHGELLLAWDDNIATVSGWWSVLTHEDRAAIGSGEAEALGFLGDNGPWTTPDVIEAARRATLTNTGCGGDVYWATTTERKVQPASAYRKPKGKKGKKAA